MSNIKLYTALLCLMILGGCKDRHVNDNPLQTDTIVNNTDTLVSEERLDATSVDTLAETRRLFHVKPFHSLQASGGLEITFTESDEFSVEAIGDTAQLNNLVCKTENGILKIYVKSKTVVSNSGNGNTVVVSSGNGNVVVNNGVSVPTSSGPVKIRIKGKLTQAMDISGACDFNTKKITTNQNFRINVSGASQTDVTQLACKDLVVHCSGASQVSLAYAQTKDVSITASGASEVTGNVKCEGIDVNASGASDCVIGGSAKRASHNESGSSTVDFSRLTIKN